MPVARPLAELPGISIADGLDPQDCSSLKLVSKVAHKQVCAVYPAMITIAALQTGCRHQIAI